MTLTELSWRSFPRTYVTLFGVSALSADTADAVGEDQYDDHDSRVVTEWNGTSPVED